MAKSSSPSSAVLAPGTRLRHDEITSFVAAGGMGEVYRERDLSLGREVALKLLPESVASDADRRARFEREARLVASLNHPNIVTIHSVEQADDKLFITMELVKGRPLDSGRARHGADRHSAASGGRSHDDQLDARLDGGRSAAGLLAGWRAHRVPLGA